LYVLIDWIVVLTLLHPYHTGDDEDNSQNDQYDTNDECGTVFRLHNISIVRVSFILEIVSNPESPLDTLTIYLTKK